MKRRRLLQLVASLPALSAVGCGGRASPAFLDDSEKKKLTYLVDLVIPADDTPGAAELGAVEYIDRLLSGEGLIFGSGPFSGRTAFPDERGLSSGVFPRDAFADAEPLDRVQRASINLLLFGGTDPEGNHEPGLRALFRDGLATTTAGTTTLEDLELDFLDALVQLVCEGCWAAPEYGGNTDMKGWALVHYEGDLMPLGFTTFDEVTGTYRERKGASTSQKDDTLDPEPIDADVEAFLGTAIVVLGGRDTKRARR